MDYVKIFKALSDETRLRIFNLFLQTEERICVCEMVDALLLPQYTISKALGILRNAKLVSSGKQGTWVYNQLNKESAFIRSFAELMKEQLKDAHPVDIARLQKRMGLRQNGVCVIGEPLKDKLDEEFEKINRT